jgi:hypothetical protein
MMNHRGLVPLFPGFLRKQAAGRSLALRRAGVCAFLLVLATPVALAASFKPVKIVVSPAEIHLTGADPQHGLLVTALGRDGREVDVTAQANYESLRPDIAAVSPQGRCRVGGHDGRTEVMVSFGDKRATASVLVQDATGVRAPSFRQDVLPVLTRAGCNMGACHGKLAGQNGFKLSLRGYAPELDIVSLVSELSGRRVNPAVPEESLILLKAVARVPHEGHQRFTEDSQAYRTVAGWVAARCPGPDTNEMDAVRLEVLPARRTLRLGETQQLLARAHYGDGRTRDVTWMAQFLSNDENIAAITPEGRVKAMRQGETAVRAHFQGLVEVVVITVPYTNQVAARDYVVAKDDALDAAVFARLRALGLPPSGPCDDATFLRRASLDATGTLPAPERVRAFLNDRSRNKRAQWVEELLRSPEWVDYWTLQLADLLQNRKERDHDVRGTKGVRSFQAWLRGEVARNRPWHELAREIITATGDAVQHPAVGYYITTIGEKRPEESEVVDSLAQAFLGTRVGCARCHNHPLEKFTQDDYYHFAAYFSKVSLQRREPAAGPTVLLAESKEEVERKKRMQEMADSLHAVEADLAKAGATGAEAESGNLKKKLTEGQKKFEDARKEYQRVLAAMPGVVQPRTRRMLEPQPLDRSAFHFKPGEDIRVALADWVTQGNPQFSGAMVNRLWRHFLGVGLVDPVDDLRASNPPSNPELWKLLNTEFVAHGYDLKHLMRLILNSRVYQLGAATRPGNESDHRFYSHYYARRLPAEVMLDAMSAAIGVPDEFKGYPVGTRAIQLPEPGVSSYFLTLFGRSDRVTACACERNGEVTLPQLLHLQNGEASFQKFKAEESRLRVLLRENKQDGPVIEELFLATLGRKPGPAELETVTRALAAGPREEAFSDLLWALLNSKEFAFNH